MFKGNNELSVCSGVNKYCGFGMVLFLSVVKWDVDII